MCMIEFFIFLVLNQRSTLRADWCLSRTITTRGVGLPPTRRCPEETRLQVKSQFLSIAKASYKLFAETLLVAALLYIRSVVAHSLDRLLRTPDMTDLSPPPVMVHTIGSREWTISTKAQHMSVLSSLSQRETLNTTNVSRVGEKSLLSSESAGSPQNTKIVFQMINPLVNISCLELELS